MLRDLIKALSRMWLPNVKFEPMDREPEGNTGTGEEVWYAGPGRYTLVEEEQIPRQADEAISSVFSGGISKQRTRRVGMQRPDFHDVRSKGRTDRHHHQLGRANSSHP